MDEDDGNILLWVALGLAAWYFLSKKFSPPPPASGPPAPPLSLPAPAAPPAASAPATSTDLPLDFGANDPSEW